MLRRGSGHFWASARLAGRGNRVASSAVGFQLGARAARAVHKKAGCAADRRHYNKSIVLLSLFDPLVAEWFTTRFGAATEPQLQGWPEIRQGHDVLISAPTGSGKTLAAFLLCIDDLVRRARSGPLPDRTEVVYVSPLKALSNDVHKNLDTPLGEIAALASRRGIPLAPIRTA